MDEGQLEGARRRKAEMQGELISYTYIPTSRPIVRYICTRYSLPHFVQVGLVIVARPFGHAVNVSARGGNIDVVGVGRKYADGPMNGSRIAVVRPAMWGPHTNTRV